MAKILMITHGPIPRIRIDREAKALVDAGHKVFIIISKQGWGSIPSFYEKVFLAPLTPAQKAFIPFSKRKAKKRYKEIIAEIKPDVLHIYDIIVASIVMKIQPKNAKVVYVDLEIWELIKKLELTDKKGFLRLPLRFYQYLAVKRLTKKVMKQADLNVVVQEHWIDFYEKRGIPRDKIISIENYTRKDMIDEALSRDDLIDDFFKSDSRKKIIHSSRACKASEDYLRDITNIVEAVAELDDWVVVIFGPNDEKFEALGAKFIPTKPYIEYLANSAKGEVALNPLVLNERLHYCSPNRFYEMTALGLRVITPKAHIFYEKFGDLLIYANTTTPKDEIKRIFQSIDNYPSGSEIQLCSEKYRWEEEIEALIKSYEQLLKE